MTNEEYVVSYGRVSTYKQVEEGEGLNIQDDRINSFNAANNYKLAAKFSDEGVSGAKESWDRKDIIRMFAYCKERNSGADKSKHIKFAVIDKVDRLSRELFHQLFIEKQLLTYGIKVLFAAQETLNDTDDSGSVMDKALITFTRQMMGAFAEFERVLINHRLSDGKKKKASKGNKPTGRQPFGYTYDLEGRDTVINETEASVVQTIFTKRVSGMSLQSIAEHINGICTLTLRMQFTTCNQTRNFTKHSVRDILTNDYYCGIVTHDGKKIQGNHEPLVDDETWRWIHGQNARVVLAA